MVNGNPQSQYRVGERAALGDTAFTVRYETPTSISPVDVSSVIEVLRRAFNGGPSWFSLGVDPADHFNWKTASAPGEAIVRLVEDGENLIGVWLSLRQRFLLGGSEVTAEVGNDSAIDPRYQGRGINSLLGEAKSAIIPLKPGCLVLDQQIHPFSKGPDAVPLGNRIDALAKPLNLRKMFAARQAKPRSEGTSRTRSAILAGRRTSFLRSILKGLPFAVRFGVSALRRSAASTDHGEWTIETADRFDARADQLWEAASAQFDLIQIRDQAWLNWRYCDPRGGPFTVRVVEQDGALLGYAALRVTETEAVIADMLTLPGREDVSRSLIADAIRWARQAEAPMLRCWMARQHPYRPALQRAGFVRYELPAPVVFEAAACSEADLEFLTHRTTRVHFMTADTDHI